MDAEYRWENTRIDLDGADTVCENEDIQIEHFTFSQIGDLLISHPGGDDLKICDFGLARRIAFGKLASLDYGKVLLQIYHLGKQNQPVLQTGHS